MLRRVSLFLAAALIASGCAGKRSASGEVWVFAATSLTAPMDQLARKFMIENRNATAWTNFGASSALVQQIQEGAKADVFAAADVESMRKLDVRYSVFARNRLVIVSKPSAGVRTLSDLTSANFVSLCSEDVPCGKYAAAALRKAGVVLAESTITRGQNAATTLTAVTEGDAAAAIVYATDAPTADKRVVVTLIPARHNVDVVYAIAVLPGAEPKLARAFVEYVRGPVGQRMLANQGFLPA